MLKLAPRGGRIYTTDMGKTTYQAVCLFFYFLRVGTTAHTYRPNAQRLEKMVFGSLGLECRMSEKELTRDKCKVDKAPMNKSL